MMDAPTPKKRVQRITFLVVALISCLATPPRAAAITGAVITQSYAGHTCGFVGARWALGSVNDGTFLTHDERIALLKRQARRAKRAQKRQLEWMIRFLKADLKAFKQLCTTLPPPRIDLARLPSLDRLIGGGPQSGAVAEAVSGIPPTFGELSSVGAESIFWAPGVIDELLSGNPSVAACAEFAGAGGDGASAGDNGCFMTQRTALAFRSILDGAKEICTLQRSLADANLSAGGVSLLSGSLPSEGIRGLISPSAIGAGRTVRMEMRNTGFGDRTLFLRVPSQPENALGRALFQMSTWRCRDNAVERSEELLVDLFGNFVDAAQVQNVSDRYLQVAVGSLVQEPDGTFRFDETRPRAALIIAGASTFFSTWAITLDASNILGVRSFSGFTNGSSVERSFTAARISGQSTRGMRFLEGAHRSNLSIEGLPDGIFHDAALEYRDTRYAAAPATALASLLSTVSFAEPFYTVPPALSINFAGYSCEAPADVTLELDFANATLAATLAPCNDITLSDFNYCGTERLRTARTTSGVKCR